jgi:6-phosphogluconolactonase
MPDLRRFETPTAAAEACGQQILDWLSAAMAEKGWATLAISGGSSPRVMFEWFAAQSSPAAHTLDWTRVHIFWVDERAVPPTDPQSNFGMTWNAWLHHGSVPESNIHRVLAEMHPERAAEKYVEEIHRVFAELSHQPVADLPHFDVMHRGMGPDAHTASLFPGEPLIDNRTDTAAAVFAEKFNQWRITLLPSVLLAAKHTAMLVTGADKAPALTSVLESERDPKRYPAQLFVDDRTAWFIG